MCRRTFLGILALSATVAVLVGAWAYHSAQDRTITALRHDLVEAANTTSSLLRMVSLVASATASQIDPDNVLASSQRTIRALEGSTSVAHTMVITDETGTVVATSREDAALAGADVSDAPFFAAHQHPPTLDRAQDTQFVGAGFYSQLDGIWRLPVSVAVRHQDGRLAGVVTLAVEADYFEPVIGSLDSADTTLLLYDRMSERLITLHDPYGTVDGPARPSITSRLRADRPDAGESGFWRMDTDAAVIFGRLSAADVIEVIVLRDQDGIASAAWSDSIRVAGAVFMVSLLFATVVWIEVAARLRVAASAQRNAQLEERLRLATGVARIGVWELDVTSDRVAWDDTMHDLYEIPRGAFEGTAAAWLAHVDPDDVDDLVARKQAAITKRGHFVTQFRITTAEGEARVVRAIGRTQTAPDGRPLRLIGINQDITAEVAREEALIAARDAAATAQVAAEAARAQAAEEALCDPLTGLANRRGLAAFLDGLGRRLPSSARIGCLHIDLDRFKAINDRYGHPTGDALLIEVSAILNAAAGENGLAARLGGDEFILVLHGAPAMNGPSCETLRAIADRIVTEIRDLQSVVGSGLQTTASVGIAAGPISEASVVATDADKALYEAKRAGRNTAMRATPALRKAALQRIDLSERLSKAIDADRLSVALQPQICAQSGAFHGAEALVRWHDPQLGPVPPVQFLPIAEDIGAIAALDRMVLRKSLAAADMLAEAGFALPHLSINVSGRRLRDPSLLNEVAGLPIRATKLAFELLETIDFDADPFADAAILSALRDHGIGVEIDDFGSGRASLTTLLRLQPDRIKLDRQLTATVGSDVPGANPMVQAIAEMGRGLGVGLTAEGVENAGQATALARLGCDVLQGYHIARPMAPQDMLRWLCARARRAEPVAGLVASV